MQLSTEREALDHLRTQISDIREEMGPAFTGSYCGPDDPLAAHLGILADERNLGSRDEGRYIPRSNTNSTPKIFVNSLITSWERKRFTFYHEVTHHLVRESDEIYSFLNELAQGDSLDNAIERFCNIGAAEFLIPRRQVQEVISEQGFSVELVKVLDERYAASLPATCIQIAQAATHQCMTVLCEYGLIDLAPDGQDRLDATHDGSHECLCALYSSASPSFKYQAGRYIPVPKDHLLMLSYEEQSYLSGKDKLLFRSGNGWPVDCEVVFYRDRVFGLFNVDQPNQVSKWQIPLF